MNLALISNPKVENISQLLATQNERHVDFNLLTTSIGMKHNPFNISPIL